MSTARSARHPVLPRATTAATRSMRPRSPIGAAARIVSRNPGRRHRRNHQHGEPSLQHADESRGPVAMSNESKCPFSAKSYSGRSNQDWWPNRLNLKVLHQRPPAGDPMGTEFDYASEFKTLDLDAVK